MSNLALRVFKVDDIPFILDDVSNILISCGMYNEDDVKRKIKECVNNTYVIFPFNDGFVEEGYRMSVGIIGCRRVFKSEIPIRFDLDYHPQINDAMYYIEFLHVKTDLLSDDETIMQVLDLAINTTVKDKNDAPVFIDSRCIGTYISNYIEILEKLHFKYYDNEGNGYFIRYPITNKTN